MEGLKKDFTVQAGELRIRTNRQCLEDHSDYFKAMFSSGMRETIENSVRLHDIDEDILRDIIDSCERRVPVQVNRGNAQRLLAAAMMLQMDALMTSAERFFISDISMENVLETFRIADFYNVSSLRDFCVRHICWHLEDLIDRFTPDDFNVVRHILGREYSLWDEDLVFRAVMAVLPNCSTDKAQELFDNIYADNVTVQSPVFDLFRSAKLGLSGHRKESCTMALVTEDFDLWLFDRRTSKFEKFTKLPVQAHGFGLPLDQHSLYMIGGEYQIGYGKWNMTVYRYDFRTDSWEHFADMKDNRRSFVTVSSKNKFYLFGGYGKFRKSLSNSVAILDLETRSWSFRECQGPPEDLQILDYERYYFFDEAFEKFRFREVLSIESLRGHTFKIVQMFRKQLILITFDNRVFLADATTKLAKQLEVKRSKRSGGPCFHRCLVLDCTMFNVDSSVITEFLIDSAALALIELNTYQIDDESTPEQHKKVITLTKIPYF